MNPDLRKPEPRKTRMMIQRRTGRLLAWGAALVVAAAMPACVSQRMGTEVPREAAIVGGGLSMSYTAVTDGILFLVDQRNLIASQTIQKGETFELEGSVELPDGARVDLVEARLYFLPHNEHTFTGDAAEYEAHDDLEDALESDPDTRPSRRDPEIDRLEEALGDKDAGEATQAAEAVSEAAPDK